MKADSEQKHGTKSIVLRSLLGNIPTSIENFLTVCILSRILASDQDEALNETNYFLAAAVSLSLLTLGTYLNYNLMQAKNTESETQAVVSTPKQISAYSYLASGGLAQAGLDFSALCLALQPNKKELLPGIFIYAIAGLIAAAHGLVIGGGDYAQSLRQAGILPKVSYDENPNKLKSILVNFGKIAPIFMSLSYLGGIFVSMRNLTVFFSEQENKLTTMIVPALLTALNLPMIFTDYLVVRSKTAYLHMTLGLEPSFALNFKSSPVAAVLNSFSYPVFLALEKARIFKNNTRALNYYDYLKFCKIISRSFMLSGIGYNVVSVFTATEEKTVTLRDHEYYLAVFVPLWILAPINGHMEFFSYPLFSLITSIQKNNGQILLADTDPADSESVSVISETGLFGKLNTLLHTALEPSLADAAYQFLTQNSGANY